jgi:hypothetical protein
MDITSPNQMIINYIAGDKITLTVYRNGHARSIGGGGYSVYELGFKRCSECGIYIKFAGPRYPCCKLPL